MSTPQPTILVVADPAHGEAICAYLAQFRFDACRLGDAAALLDAMQRRRVDLVVLDLKLPGDGLALLRRVRATSDAPVILLGDSSSATDRVVGLEMGADDCLDQPFVKRELAARIQTVLRRVRGAAALVPQDTATDLIRFDGWELRRSERHLRSPAGRPVPLSNAEFRLLDAFLKTPRCVVTRDQLMSQARDRAGGGEGRSSIDLLVSRLRQKLGAQQTGTALISTVRGLGYRFDARSVEGAGGRAAR